MFDPSFRQQASAWQRQFQLRNQGSFLQRLLAWLVLGMMLLVGAFFLLFALLLSCTFIIIYLRYHRHRIYLDSIKFARQFTIAKFQTAP